MDWNQMLATGRQWAATSVTAPAWAVAGAILLAAVTGSILLGLAGAALLIVPARISR